MTKEDIRVQVSPDRVLSISGERRSETKEGSEEEGHLVSPPGRSVACTGCSLPYQ